MPVSQSENLCRAAWSRGVDAFGRRESGSLEESRGLERGRCGIFKANLRSLAESSMLQ